jgi:hypothetical protein
MVPKQPRHRIYNIGGAQALPIAEPGHALVTRSAGARFLVGLYGR